MLLAVVPLFSLAVPAFAQEEPAPAEEPAAAEEPVAAEEATEVPETIALDDGIMPVAATTGSCGDSATWTLSDTGALSISGTGAIKSYAFMNNTSVKTVIIASGITDIEFEAFRGCSKLSSLSLPASVTSIGSDAFAGCTSLSNVTILNPECSIYDHQDTMGVYGGTTTIHGYDGSTAQTYAEKYGYPFETLDSVPTPTPEPTASPVPTSEPTSEPTPEPTATPTPAKLAAPTVKIGAATNGGISVSWNAVYGSPLYMVYYRENGGSWKKIGTTSKTAYTHKASKLKNGVTYEYTVRCCASNKKTMLSGYTASNSLKYTK